MAAGLIIFSPDDETIGFTTGDELAVNTFLDIENDILYFTDASRIYAWEGDSGNSQTYNWKSGKLRMKNPVNMGAAIVEADSYVDVEFKLYAEIDGTMVLKHTETVADGEPFRLPGGYLANVYEMELTGTDTVTRVSVAENIWEIAEG
jgi:hypothetical protein